MNDPMPPAARGTRERFAAYMRNFIFGVEDSLVATSGLLSGVAIANTPRHIILLSGIVLIFVEAFSMAAGSFLAEASAEEYITRSEAPTRVSWIGGIVMFFSYFVSGFIPLAPYMVLPGRQGFFVSIALSLITLFALGIASAKVSRIHLWKSALRMVIMGGIAIGVGITVGVFVPQL